MPQKFANNLQAVLSADITSTTISIPVVSTAGFPALGAGDWFYLTLTDKREGGEKRWEIVKVTAFSNNVLTVNRAQDGTTGQAWAAGSELSLRVTAGDMQSLKDGTTQAGDTVTLTGDVTGTATVSANGNISVATTIAANSVALGTDTTGNYVASLVPGTSISVGAAGEGATPTITNTAPNVTTDITTTHNATNVVVNSSDGTDGTINAATTTLAGVMSSADKTKLDGIATGAEVNQNAFSNVLVGTTTLSADSKTDTLNLVAGTNVTLTADAGTDTITISADDVSVDWSQVQNKPDPVITLAGDLSGSVTLTDLGSGTLTATIQPNSVALGTDTTGNYVAGVTQGTDVLVTGTAGEGWSPTISVDSASANTANKLVKRDASGNFSAGTITAALSGNATTATTLQTARTINGVSFNGSANITIADSTKIPTTEKGVANGVATLGADGKVPSTQLPSYVDDVQEYTNLAGFPTTGEAGKIYVALDTNKTYRWSGSAYVYITSGAVDSVAGKTGVVTLVKGDVGLGNVDNTSDAAKPVSTATQTALNLKANLASPALTGTPTAPTAAVGTNTTQLATTAFVEAATAPATLLNDIKTVDGSGSGLDADLLDGLDSTVFTRSGSTVALTGDVTGTATVSATGAISVTTTIAANSVALGTDTTGNYVAGVTQGAGITVTGTAGEGWSPTIAHADTSSVASLAALTGAAVISNLDFDTYGHVTAIATRALTALDIGAQTASRASATFTTVANGWYRIATSAVDIARNSGEFAVDWTVSGNHGSARFAADCHYGEVAGTSIMQTNYSKFGTGGIVAARIVYHPTHTANYAYVEVKFAAALTNVAVNVELQDALGWSLTTPSTAGSIPSGYSNYEHAFISAGAITAGTYPKVTINQEGRVTSGTALVAADIPALDTGKLTTGTLPVARGGTGVTTSTGSGSVVLSTSPSLTTPNIGVATGTSFNSITGLASAAPSVAGTAAIGTSTLAARQDHVHPAQTSVTGNAGTATTLQNARTIALSGAATGTATSFNGSANITIPVTSIDGSNITWATAAAAGKFDTSTTTPTGTTRLNYGGYLYPTAVNLVGQSDTTTDATHYYVETGSDGFVRPKTLANVKAEIGASIGLTGTPTAPTATSGTSSTQIATTAFVQSEVNGYLSKTGLTGGTVVLTAAEASNNVINLSGALTSNLIVELPTTAQRMYSVTNGTTGAFTTSIKVTGKTPTVLVAQGKRNIVYVNGLGAYDAINDFESIALTGTPTAPTAAVGTNTTQLATTAFVEAATAPATLLDDIKTVDGSGSGLDADTLDGQHASAFAVLKGTATQYGGAKFSLSGSTLTITTT